CQSPRMLHKELEMVFQWACGSTRIAEGPDSESGSLGGAIPFMPTNFAATGFSGNSRPRRLKIAEPSGCKSRVADRRVVNREQQTGSIQDRTALGVQVSPRQPIGNVNRTSGQADRAS